MMKKLIIVVALFTSLATFAQNGWRDQEMEVRVWLRDASEAQQLYRLHLNGDVYPDGTGLLYLIPTELEKLNTTGIRHEIIKPDLNDFYSGFWDVRVEAYHSYQEIIDLADSLAQYFPDICQKTVHGFSVEGRQLASLKISDNALQDETEPVVWFDGGIHGDEIGGAENLIRFARDLCLGYGTDPSITSLVNSREIWLYLMVNPDGRVNMERYNSNGVDLNRDWGYMWDGWGGSPEPYSQAETKVMRDLMIALQASVSITYHSGIELALYPWGYRYGQANDDPHLNFLANHYSDVSGYDNLVAQQSVGLYPVNGSTSDMCYGVLGSASLTLEISTNKQPPVSQLQYYYQINYPSMIAMIEQSGLGIGGRVTDAQTGAPVGAAIYVGNFYPTYSSASVGDFHKFVLPGTYSVKVTANGYETQWIEDVVVIDNGSANIEVELQPLEEQYGSKVVTVQIPGNNEADEGYTPGALGAPDEVSYSLGKNGWLVVDMQQTILDGIGDDILVHEGDDSPESYTCFASLTPDGPWNMLGTGTGTSSFDFAGGTVPEARYIKVLDDGDGAGSVSNAGFDLDALEAVQHPSGTYLTLISFILDDNNGDGYLDPGETADILITLRNNGNVMAENIQAILMTGQLFVAIDSANTLFDNMAYGESAAGKFTITANALTPVGFLFGLEMVLEANNGSYTDAFDFELTVGNIGEDWETGGFDKFAWTTGGNAPWSVTEGGAFEGTYCARSGNVSDNGSSTLSVTMDILANGEISFYRKVSSEPGYDFLEFYIDNTLVDHWSGELGWGQASYLVYQGSHTFKWSYVKDVYVSSGSDCGWIDLIQFPPVIVTNLGTLTGTVTSLSTGFPLEGASISGVALTGSDGTYSVDLGQGTFEICASLDGYETLCLETTVAANQVTTLDFQLMPAEGIDDQQEMQRDIHLFPNPSSGRVAFSFYMQLAGSVQVEIYSADGSSIYQSPVLQYPEGRQTFIWDGSGAHGGPVLPGLYTTVIRMNRKISSIKFLRQ